MEAEIQDNFNAVCCVQIPALLQENGFYLLQEDGSKILIE